MKKRILSVLLCLVLILALTAQIVLTANAEIYDTMDSPIILESGKTYGRMTMLRYERVGYDYSATIEGSVPGMSFSTTIMDAIYISAFYYLQGTPTHPGTYPITLWLRDAKGNVIMEQHYEIIVKGDQPVNSVKLELAGYGAGASISGANIQIKTEGVEFAAQGAANGFVFQATDSRTAAPITSGVFQEKADYYVMVVLDIKSGYLRNYDTDSVTLTVNGQAATKAKGGMNNIAGNNGNSKLLVRFKLPKLAHAHTPGGAWLSDGTNHWKLCDACGEKAEVAAHSGGENSCRYKAQCDVCEAFYGDFADHEWSKKWDYSDEKGHYHTCQTPGCDKLSYVTAHTPGAAATATTPQTCKDCGYVIKAAQGHTHKTEKVTEVAATCTTDGNREYYVCEGCGKWFQDAKATKEITREADVILTATGHSLEDSWLYDTYTHWQECACGEVGKKAAHTDEDGDLICDTCGREEDAPDKQKPEATKPATNKTDKPSTDKAEKPDDTDSGNTGLVILVCVLAVLVLGAGAALVVILINRKEKE